MKEPDSLIRYETYYDPPLSDEDYYDQDREHNIELAHHTALYVDVAQTALAALAATYDGGRCEGLIRGRDRLHGRIMMRMHQAQTDYEEGRFRPGKFRDIDQKEFSHLLPPMSWGLHCRYWGVKEPSYML